VRNLKTEGIIIKRRDFNEADRMITILTRDMGKISVKATGVKRITSRRASHIELLNHTKVSLYKKSQIPVLIEAQMINSFSEIKNSLEKTGFAYHICELIDGLCPEEQVQPEIFLLLKNTLNELSLADNTEEFLLIIHGFEIELLTLLGFWHKRPEESTELDTHQFIENIMERKLKSHRIFSKLH
jgi:DNA repair protein RecO (recombination protein O)